MLSDMDPGQSAVSLCSTVCVVMCARCWGRGHKPSPGLAPTSPKAGRPYQAVAVERDGCSARRAGGPGRTGGKPRALPERSWGEKSMQGWETGRLELAGGRRQAELWLTMGTSEAGRWPESKHPGHVLRFWFAGVLFFCMTQVLC